jgi:hypothetical protein
VVVAGDVYDVETPSDRTLRRPIERQRAFPTLNGTTFTATAIRTSDDVVARGMITH